MYTEKRVILAADELTHDSLLELLGKIGSRIHAVKVHNMYDLYGPQIVAELRGVGVRRVWVDAKLHDIPNTVKLRAEALALSGCDMITVHASGGIKMMVAAKEGFGVGKVFGVTALTSLDDHQIQTMYNASIAAELVDRLAPLIKESGIAGLVCSPKELPMLREQSQYQHLQLVVPGIRSTGVDVNDQKRVDTPGNAIKAGATYLVIGRQITQAKQPVSALDALETELAAAEGVAV
jgi:orotidine-5'-phosphate decarboxylase